MRKYGRMISTMVFFTVIFATAVVGSVLQRMGEKIGKEWP